MATRYPSLLVHGLNWRDDWAISYWGAMVRTLKGAGYAVFLSGQDALGSVAGNAEALRRRGEEVLVQTGAERLNLVAHSKGGIECRLLISGLGFGSRTASLTTICTPHHGSKSAAYWLTRPRLCRLAGGAMESFWRARGDLSPDFLAALEALTPAAMERFNLENPDDPQVYYQSWQARLLHPGWDPMDRVQLWLTKTDAPTDGLVSPESAVWGRDRGILEDVSHQDAAGGRRRKHQNFSAVQFYLHLAAELAEMGF